MLNFEQGNPELFNIPDNIVFSNKPTVNIDILGKTAKDIKISHKNIYNSWFSQKTPPTKTTNKSKLEGLEAKLYTLFLLKDKKSINKIINGIDLIEPKYSGQEAYLHLAKGYYCELNDEVDQAINEYGLAESPKTTESALKRLALISLDRKEYVYAHDILKVLSEISPDYLPQLAELYAITKNYKDALDTYNDYLDYNSTDIRILIKTAQLYESQNIFNGAQYLYNQVLKLEPENQVAKSALKKLND